MAASLDPATVKTNERRKRVVVGELPSEFLRLPGTSSSSSPSRNENLTDPNTGLPLTPQQIQERMDEQAALALHQQLNAQAVAAAVAHTPTNIRGRLLISVMQVMGG